MKQISITESTVAEAMAQIDALENLNAKQRSCLRLLTEEMYSMVNELLKVDKLDFEIGIDDLKYTLRVIAKTYIDSDMRKKLIAVSTDGRNAANKGVKGILGAAVEALLYGDSVGGMDIGWRYGMCQPIEDYSSMWALSQYMNQAPSETAKSDWDGMEKSIIASFSDDIMIGVRHGKLEMTVIKIFN